MGVRSHTSVLVLLLDLVACRSTDEQWSFAVTRAVVEASSDSYSGYAGRDAPLSGGPDPRPGIADYRNAVALRGYPPRMIRSAHTAVAPCLPCS